MSSKNKITTIVIDNRALDPISNDRDFGMKLSAAIRKLPYSKEPIGVPAGIYRNAAVVLSTREIDPPPETGSSLNAPQSKSSFIENPVKPAPAFREAPLTKL